MLPLIEAQNISFRVPEKGKVILNDINLTVFQGQIVTLVGPNGGGKTTLLKILTGGILPTKGKIIKSPHIRFSYVPQKLNLNPLLPIPVRTFMSLGNQAFPDEIHQALSQYGVCHTLDNMMNNISGGERQRVMVARAILTKPDILALDEPAQGLDISNQTLFYKNLEALREERGITIVLVSHDLHWVMASSDQVICINQHICCAGTPESVSTHQSYADLFPEMVPDQGGVAPYVHHHDHTHEGGCTHKNGDPHHG